MCIQIHVWNHRDDLALIEFQQEEQRSLNVVLGPQPNTVKQIWEKWRNFIIFLIVGILGAWALVGGIGYWLWKMFR